MLKRDGDDVQAQTHGPRELERVGVSNAITRLCNSLLVARRAAIDGLGIAWLPEYVARAEVARGALAPVLESFWPAPTPIHLVYASSQHLAPQVRAAVELLATSLRKVHA